MRFGERGVKRREVKEQGAGQVVNRLDERLKEIAKAGAWVVKKVVLGKEPGIKKGHFPCLDRGTQGYAVMFRRLWRSCLYRSA